MASEESHVAVFPEYTESPEIKHRKERLINASSYPAFVPPPSIA